MSDIVLYQKFDNPMAAIERLGEAFAQSLMFGFNTKSQGMVIAMEMLATNKSPTQILREYHIIEGRLTDRADSMLAKFRAKGGRHKILCRTCDRAEVELKLEDQVEKFSLSFADVKEEPFVKSDKDASGLKKNWRTPRARMQTLWARVISDGVRSMAPEIVAGIYTPEEVEDEEITRAELRLEPASSPKVQDAAVETLKNVSGLLPPSRTSPPEDEKELAAKGLAPQTAAAPAASQASQPVASTPAAASDQPAAPLLCPDTTSKLEQALSEPDAPGKYLAIAIPYLINIGFLKPGQQILRMSEKHAKQIIDHRNAFIAKAQQFEEAKK
jgi:hypothetical protein